ncbi:MAG: hypothetical protein Q4Q13_00740 [Vagococcus sp.]|nr:hypothetical protein [Vagococcus sp.]
MTDYNYHDLVFRRGYLIVNQEIDCIPNRWIQITDIPAPWRAYVDPLLPLSRVTREQLQIIALGFFSSIHFPGKSPSFLLDKLAERYSDPHLNPQTLIDSFQGQFVLFIFQNNSLTAQSDAMALCPLFYYTGPRKIRIACSHVRLAADITGVTMNSFSSAGFYASNGSDQNFADTTSYHDLYRVPANLELNLNNASVNRIYPRELRHQITVQDAVEQLKTAAHNHIEVLLSNSSPYNRIIVSITAGIDTRTNLVLLKPYVDKLEFFTFDPPTLNKYSKYDLETVKQLIKLANIRNHTFIESNSEVVTPTMNTILRRTTEFRYSGKVAQALYKNYHNDPLTIHLRSSGYEIGRGYYRKSGYNTPNEFVGPEHYEQIICQGHTTTTSVTNAYEDFWRKTTCHQIAANDYDPLDLLVWEHRMSVWHSTIIQEHNLTFDSAVLINSRDIWDMLISVPPEKRPHAAVFRTLMRQEWPALEKIPVNGLPLLPTSAIGKMKRYYGILKNHRK